MNLPSCLDMVNHVLQECGDLTVASLNPGNRNSYVALQALNDATSDIWETQRWPWQRVIYNLALVANQDSYALPDRFDRLAEPIRLPQAGSYQALKEFTTEEWAQLNMGPAITAGSPHYFKIENNTLYFDTAPSSDYITTYPFLVLTYFQEQPDRKTIDSSADAWDVPGHFYSAMISFGKAKLKQYLGSVDWQIDMKLYEDGMRTHLNKVRQGRVPARVRPLNYVIREW